MDNNLLIAGGIILAVAVLAVIIAMIILMMRRSRPKRRTRRYQRDENGQLIIAGMKLGEPITLMGTGAYHGGLSQLQSGDYVISYELETPTRIALVDEQDGHEKTLVMSSGVGVKEFNVETAGRYLWRVEPNIQTSNWRLNYRRVPATYR